MTKESSALRVCVVGLGLIGGSLAWQLKTAGVFVKGFARNPETLQKAQERGMISESSVELAVAVTEVDLVVVALPIESIPEMVHKIDLALTQPTVVMDVGSVKTFIQEQVGALPLTNAIFVGGHPMAGSEKIGIDNAVQTLFVDRPFVVSYPSQEIKSKAKKVVTQLVETLQARYVEMTAQDHDERVAVISHLPYLVSVLVYRRYLEESQKLSEVASTGFRDVTRIAHSDPLWGVTVAQHNSKNLVREIDKFIQELTEVKQEITSHSRQDLLNRFNVDGVGMT
ncbi:MAG: prephenate dehydrogenase/arogenate dehydrogenase family protein [Candidatus Margulisiibacteriota bacterium]